jgi:hypothetical protein
MTKAQPYNMRYRTIEIAHSLAFGGTVNTELNPPEDLLSAVGELTGKKYGKRDKRQAQRDLYEIIRKELGDDVYNSLPAIQGG